MIHGFIKVAAVTPALRVADPVYNAEEILKEIKICQKEHARIIVFPELALTGATCGDLFLQSRLLAEAEEQLWRICEETQESDALLVIGLPAEVRGKLYNVAAILHQGELLGLVPKNALASLSESAERRVFTEGSGPAEIVDWGGDEVPFGANLLFSCEDVAHLTVAVDLGDDLSTPLPGAAWHAQAGATVLCHLDAAADVVDADRKTTRRIEAFSETAACAVIYAAAGEGESTTDQVYAGRSKVYENGYILASAQPFENGAILTEVDVDQLAMERRRRASYPDAAQIAEDEGYVEIPFSLELEETKLTRKIDAHPFVPEEAEEVTRRCEEILRIQAQGLKKRMAHTGLKKAVLGVSGGLDSTLALLVTAQTMDLLGLPRKNILAVTMPGFGTTDRTYENACALIKQIGATFREIPIGDAVTVHFKDIKHDSKKHDATYENAQARERMQILMDVANQENGLVVGTGDLSELALGWATYNGDHMSMYGVNGGIPKTLLRSLVRHYADNCGKKALQSALLDVLDTPVSPELLPPKRGKIAQKTEELVGPYELHDFFLYHMLRAGETPAKIFRLAEAAFAGVYDSKTILQWQKTFTRRFFHQQFKRSCLPDGPRVGSVAVSPRGSLNMPSDAAAEIWLSELEHL